MPRVQCGPATLGGGGDDDDDVDAAMARAA